MATVCLVLFAGVALLVILIVLVPLYRDALLNQHRRDVEEQARSARRKKEEYGPKLVESLATGSVAARIEDYTQQVGSLLPQDELPGGRWKGDEETLLDWQKRETRRRNDQVHRSVAAQAAVAALLILLVTSVALVPAVQSLEPGEKTAPFAALAVPPAAEPPPPPLATRGDPPPPAPVPAAPPAPVPIPPAPINPPDDPPARPATGRAIRGQVVSQKTGTPVAGAEVCVAQDRAQSQADGSFEVRLSFDPHPTDEVLVVVSHKSYLTHVLRLDRLNLSARVPLVPRRRVTVLTLGGTLPGETFAEWAADLRSPLEERLRRSEAIELTDSENRAEVIRRIGWTLNAKPLYDRETLQSIGRFRGASHMVTGRVSKTTTGLLLYCELVELETTTTEASAYVSLSKTAPDTHDAEELAEALMAQLAEATILYPANGAVCPRQARVVGSMRSWPPAWAAFLFVQPDENGRFYPQAAVAEFTNGLWRVPNVHVGEEFAKGSNETFAIHLVLCDPRLSATVNRYIEDIKTSPGKNVGMDLAQFGKDRCRLLSHVVVRRAADAAAGAGRDGGLPTLSPSPGGTR